MYRSPFLLILSILLASCSSAKPGVITIMDENVHPKLIWKGQNMDGKIIEEFQALFLKATNHKIELTSDENNESLISLKIDKTQTDQFKICYKNKLLQIEGSNEKALRQGVNYFFLNYLSYYPFKNTDTHQKVLAIPSDLEYTQKVSFEYREPYFRQNYEAELFHFNQTNQLEETWGIWGHQISKLATQNPDFCAEIEGLKTTNQLCFSSKPLEKEIIKIIESKSKENKNVTKFMLMPADNNLVCMCESCVNNGNSKLNASPAVFKLINKLAQKFPHFQIFSTAYVTTNNPPSFQLEKNAGVMLSTMSFPKGIVYEKTNYKSTIEGTLKSWKSVTKTIYVWDYGIHFDLYLSSYPSLLIHQENIQFFKKNGITGIFMQGNEESFAAFEGLKYFVYAQLMLNPETDVRALIRFYLEGQFPKAGTVLANYYLEIEERALNSKHEMDIYGGWNQQLKKYLSFQPLKNLMLELEELESKTSKDELDELKTLKIAFNFQLLEIMRVNGIGNEGYAYINKSGEKQIKPEVKQMVGKIEQLKQETKFDILNESHAALSNYIEFWYSEVFQKKIQILVPDLKIKAISKLDEDYSDLNILTNGKVGFLDYDNNWLITTGQALHLEIDPKSALGSKTFSIRLLQDLKHGIYFPQKIQLTIGKEIYTAEIPRDELKKALTTYAIQIPIKKFKIEDKMSVLMIKQMEFKNKSTACGELQFTKR